MPDNKPVDYSAEKYDHYTDTFVSAYDDLIISRVKDELDRMGGGRLVRDIGTGTARLPIKMANLPGLNRLEMIGLDYFADMVAQAAHTVAGAGLSHRIGIVRGDVHALPHQSRSIDIIISRSTIHHWADPVRAFTEIGRVLKPNGVAVIHDVRRDPEPKALADFNRRRAEAGVVQSNLEGKYTPDEVAELIDRAGFSKRAQIYSADSGPGALGFELRIEGR